MTAAHERCSLTELLVDQCAHCRAPRQPMQVNPSESYGPVFVASFGGSCADCGDRVEEGDRIAALEVDREPAGYVHEECIR